MKIGFIGAGKVGSAFGHYLRDNGLNVIGYCSRSQRSAQLAAEFTGTWVYDIEKLVENCEYIFITTPDDVISEVWRLLKSLNLQDKKIFHMSGSLSSSVFDGIGEHGAYGYSFHPLFPFIDRNSYKGLGEAVFTIEGKNIALIEGFLSTSKTKYFEISGENKIKYHAAAVFASNYIVSLSKISKELLIQCGIPENRIAEAIYPLMQGAVENIREKGVDKALTGPISRGDTGTVELHRNILGEYLNAYDELGRIALKISYEGGNLTDSKMKEILNILGGKDYEKNSCNL